MHFWAYYAHLICAYFAQFFKFNFLHISCMLFCVFLHISCLLFAFSCIFLAYFWDIVHIFEYFCIFFAYCFSYLFNIVHMFEQFAYFLLSGLLANYPQMSMFGTVIGLHKPQGESLHSHCECFHNQCRDRVRIHVSLFVTSKEKKSSLSTESPGGHVPPAPVLVFKSAETCQLCRSLL